MQTALRRFGQEIRANRYIYLMMVPGLLFLFVFSYMPLSGYLLAFKDYTLQKGIWGSPFVGLKNFQFFFSTRDWLPITLNTLYLNALFILFGMGFAVVLAVLLSEVQRTWLKRLLQSGVFLPYFVSWMVVQQMMYALLASQQGLLTQTILALTGKTVSFYATPGYWRVILTLVYVWRFSGYYAVIFIGAVTSIDPAYYESAVIDGASRLQMVLRITLPLIRKTVLVMMLMATGRIFYGDTGMLYGLIGDNSLLYSTTDVIDTYAYRAMRQTNSFSMSSAITVCQAGMGVLTILLFNWIAKRIEPDARLF